MKAHLPSVHIVQPNRYAVRAACAKELEAEKNDLMRRFIKIMVQSLRKSKKLS